MKRFLTVGMVSVLVMLGVSVHAPLQAKAPGPNGQIAFARQDPSLCRDCDASFIANPDGTHERKLFEGAGAPRWSPDGTQLTVFPGCSFDASCAAVIVDADTGISHVVPNLQPGLINQFFACLVWSPDGARLACIANGDTLGSGNVVYTIRSSDGGGLSQVLPCPNEGCDVMDYSPDGGRLLISRLDPSGQRELFSVKLDGTGLHRITPSGTIPDFADAPSVASWSPDGVQIVFGGRTDSDHARSIFVVNADGTGLHQVPISGCGTLKAEPRIVSCYDPGWSPDGTTILFARAKANHSTILGKPSELNSAAIWSVNPNGSGLTQVTTATNHGVSGPDWGSHPLTG